MNFVDRLRGRRFEHVIVRLAWAAEIVVLLAGVSLTYAYWDDNLRADFLGSFLASTLALVVGIPIAIHVNDLQRAAALNEGGKLREREENLYRDRIIALIRHELTFNKRLLSQRRIGNALRYQKVEGARAEAPTLALWAPLKQELWRAVSDSGEIKHIHDPDVLDVIVRAYYRIAITIEFERRHMDAILQLGLGGRPKAVQKFKQILLDSDAVTVAAIEEALQRLDTKSTGSADAPARA